jgi:hypothetical protein
MSTITLVFLGVAVFIFAALIDQSHKMVDLDGLNETLKNQPVIRTKEQEYILKTDIETLGERAYNGEWPFGAKKDFVHKYGHLRNSPKQKLPDPLVDPEGYYKTLKNIQYQYTSPLKKPPQIIPPIDTEIWR